PLRGVTGYSVSVTPTTDVTGATTRSSGTATSLHFDGLTDGTAYTFTVTATNANGTSPASVTSLAVTPALSTPGVPTAVAATPDVGSVALSWTAPLDDGG